MYDTAVFSPSISCSLGYELYFEQTLPKASNAERYWIYLKYLNTRNMVCNEIHVTLNSIILKFFCHYEKINIQNVQ